MATIKASDYTKDIGVDHSASQTSNFLNCKGIHGLMDLFKDTASDLRIIRLALDKL